MQEPEDKQVTVDKEGLLNLQNSGHLYGALGPGLVRAQVCVCVNAFWEVIASDPQFHF